MAVPEVLPEVAARRAAVEAKRAELEARIDAEKLNINIRTDDHIFRNRLFNPQIRCRGARDGERSIPSRCIRYLKPVRYRVDIHLDPHARGRKAIVYQPHDFLSALCYGDGRLVQRHPCQSLVRW